jgi:hypothetical protein
MIVRHWRLVLISPVIVMSAIIAVGLISSSPTQAHLNGFEAGNIMSDTVMGNKDSLTEAQIQSFLKSKNACNDSDYSKYQRYSAAGYSYSWKNGHFVCMADEIFGSNGLPASEGQSAAHIIWQAAQDYSINPQVLIVLLQKEQGLITDTWPNHGQYRTATGFGCPDTAPCDSQYYGLNNQIRQAAKLFRDVLNGGWSNYPAYSTVYVRYSPDASCGGSNVYIANRATSALYRYTPYQPNAAALAAGTGTAACGAYGNRNFYHFFTEWFGSTTEFLIGDKVSQRYNALGGANGTMGRVLNSQICPEDNTCWQEFANGFIIWNVNSGAWESKGGIRDRWSALGFQGGSMGYPIGPEVWDGKGWWQNYQNGAIIGTDATGFWESKGGIRNYWGQNGWQGGSFGYPISPEFWDNTLNGWYQKYQKGIIYFTSQKGAWGVKN